MWLTCDFKILIQHRLVLYKVIDSMSDSIIILALRNDNCGHIGWYRIGESEKLLVILTCNLIPSMKVKEGSMLSCILLQIIRNFYSINLSIRFYFCISCCFGNANNYSYKSRAVTQWCDLSVQRKIIYINALFFIFYFTSLSLRT